MIKQLFRILLNLLTGFLTEKNLPGQNARTFKTSIPLGSGYKKASEELFWRNRMIAFARGMLGAQYRLGVEVLAGHESTAREWDCSELIEGCYRRVGLFIPDGAAYQYNYCRPVDAPLAGDLGFLWSDKRNMIGHVMLHTGERSVIHAVAGRGVVEDACEKWTQIPRWRGWRRHPEFSRGIV